MKQVPISEIEQLTRGVHGQPHAVLGPHPEGTGVTFRVYKPLARTVTVVTSDGTRVPLEHEHDGVWVGVLGSDGSGEAGGLVTGVERPPRPADEAVERPPRPTDDPGEAGLVTGVERPPRPTREGRRRSSLTSGPTRQPLDSADLPASSRATGTRNGEQET